MKKVSVILTVYNEEENIGRLIASLASQRVQPDEIVICDGGSRDGTVEQIHKHVARYQAQLPAVRVLVEPGANISRGRNIAIRAAEGPIIVATDAGVRLSPEWLAELTEPWHTADERGHPLAAAGFFLPDAEGVFPTAMAATVLPLHEDIAPETFLPSSRSVAFRKQAWAAVGGYPEWLDYCEDLIFDMRVNALDGARESAFVWRPDALVYFRPRQSLGSFWKQYFHYARGDGKADLWRKRHAIRYCTYLIAIPALAGHGFWGARARWLGWLGLAVGGLLYCWRPWARLQTLGSELTRGQRVAAMLLVPVIRLVGDLAKMAGYPVGLWWRWRNRRRAEVYWKP